jgi:hypothetical protein
MSRNASMVNANKIKIGELEDNLMTSLRDAVAGRDVASASFSDDEVTAVEAVMHRLSLLAMSRDLVETLENVEGGQSSGWEIILAFADRGKLGYGGEVKVCTAEDLAKGRWSISRCKHCLHSLPGLRNASVKATPITSSRLGH